MPGSPVMTAPVSRRSFVRAAAIGGAMAGAADLLRAVPADTTTTLVAADPDLHLLRRATHGPTPQLARELRRLGRDRWLDRQLDPSSVRDSFCEDYVADRYPDLDMTMTRAFATLDGSWDLMYALGQATTVRAVWSRRQLFELMVDFWSNHLNVTNPHEACWWSRHDYDRRVIRKHALGTFANMLRASTTHPAMMTYLNNAESSRDNPNENYGREILELHSVGVDGGYDEDDMRQSTMALTGFGISWETGSFEYHPWDHFVGPVDVMGFHAANRGEDEGKDVGLAYVDYLAHHPSTATRIARKLCYRFVSDRPPESLVNALAETYLDHDTAIAPVLRKLFRSKAFEASVGRKVRRPFEDVTATLRILGIRPDPRGIDGQQGLYWMLEGLGHLPMGWVPPDGYPDTGDPWRSAGLTLGRWNMHMGLAAGWWPANHLQVPNLRKTVLPRDLPLTLDSSFGLHPSMAPLTSLYDAGSLGIVHAVGMARPNRSHFSAMEEMERAAPGTSVRTGWLDRVLGLREPSSPFQASQLGSNSAAPAFLGPAPELAMWNVDGFELAGAWDSTESDRWDTALRNVHDGAPAVIGAPALTALDALSTASRLRAAGYTPENGAVYPATGLGDAMRDVARLIKAGVGLQVAAVDYGDWDMHADQGSLDGGWMVDHLTELSTALAAFATDLGSAMSDVTLITLTEFGRRIEENGSGGTDHGFGQAVFLLGGGVRGAQVHGSWPGLAPADLLDGDLDATTDYRNLLAEVLEKRCGAGSSDIAGIFPGISGDRLDVVRQRPS